MAEPAEKKDCYLFVPDPENLPAEVRKKIEEALAAGNLRMILEGTGPYTPCPTPTQFLFRSFDFMVVDGPNSQIRLQEKLLRMRTAVIDTIPAGLRERYRHLPCQTLLPVELNGFQPHGIRPPDRIRAFCDDFLRVDRDKVGRPPDTDVSLLPFILEIDGVTYQRVIPPKSGGQIRPL